MHLFCCEILASTVFCPHPVGPPWPPLLSPDVAYEPVRLTFLVPGLAALGPASNQLATLRRVLAPTCPWVSTIRWTEHALKLRNALIALDGRAAGATYRDIAIVLEGREKAERDWGSGLKERVRRDLRRGAVLARGRYRRLLR